MLTRHPGRLRSFDYVGLNGYFLTFCTDNRCPHFTESARVELVLEQILRAATDTGFAIVAYCFMPDHAHLLVEAQCDASDCRQFINRAKQFSGYYFQQQFNERLWQRYGFDHVVRNDEAMLGIARYILENPIRGGLVLRIEDYPFAGSFAYPLHEILEAVAMRPTTRKSG
jgi:putative transposase